MFCRTRINTIDCYRIDLSFIPISVVSLSLKNEIQKQVITAGQGVELTSCITKMMASQWPWCSSLTIVGMVKSGGGL